MSWIIFVFIIILAICSIISYKYGEINELHKIRAEFEHYLDAHSAVKDSIKEGIELAENIIDDMLEDESL